MFQVCAMAVGRRIISTRKCVGVVSELLLLRAYTHAASLSDDVQYIHTLFAQLSDEQ